MDKKWRNLVIIVLILVLFIAGYFYFTKNPVIPSTPIQSDEDKEYLALANLFALSDINVIHFRTNELVVGDSNELRLVYSKDKLLTFANDLNELRDWSKNELDSKRYAKFSSLIDIYQAEISTNILLANFSKKFNSVIQSNSRALLSNDERVYCDFVSNHYPDFTIGFDDISNSMIDLSEKNYNYYLNYDVLVIDYDFNGSWTSLNYAWTSIYEDIIYCDERGLVE